MKKVRTKKRANLLLFAILKKPGTSERLLKGKTVIVHIAGDSYYVKFDSDKGLFEQDYLEGGNKCG